MIEKPVALNLGGLRELQAAVHAAKVKTVVSFVLRWNPLFETIRAMLADGLIGKLFSAEVDYLHGLGPWYAQYYWNIKKEMAGSSLLTGGCHAADGLRWFVGKKAVEVFAYANTSPDNPLHYEYEANSITLVRFEDGTIGKVASSVESIMPYVFRIQLLGDQGAIRNNEVFTNRWPGPEQLGGHSHRSSRQRRRSPPSFSPGESATSSTASWKTANRTPTWMTPRSPMKSATPRRFPRANTGPSRCRS